MKSDDALNQYITTLSSPSIITAVDDAFASNKKKYNKKFRFSDLAVLKLWFDSIFPDLGSITTQFVDGFKITVYKQCCKKR